MWVGWLGFDSDLSTVSKNSAITKLPFGETHNFAIRKLLRTLSQVVILFLKTCRLAGKTFW